MSSVSVSVSASVVSVGVGKVARVTKMIAVAVGVGSVPKTVVGQPGVSLGVSLSLSSWLGLGLSLAVVSEVVGKSVVAVDPGVGEGGVAVGVGSVVVSVPVGIGVSGIVSQPGVSLRVSLGLSLSGGLSLLYGHDGIVLSSGGSSRSHSERGEGGENSVSARDEGSLIVPTAGSSGVDKRNVVVGTMRDPSSLALT